MEDGKNLSVIGDILKSHLNPLEYNEKSSQGKQLKEMEKSQIQNLYTFLMDDWKTIMLKIDGKHKGTKRFSNKDIRAIETACLGRPMWQCLEMVLREWSTMQEWGIDGKPAKRFPNITDLLDICNKINNQSAASYINHTILENEPSYLEDEQIVEDTIDDSNARGSSEEVLCISYGYLRKITNNFDDRKSEEGGMKIGQGGFSDVFLGMTSRKHYKIAIKNMKRGVGKDKTSLLRRQGTSVACSARLIDFEVEHLRRLKHPNILCLYGYSKDNPNEPCLIYAYMKNGTLAQRLRTLPRLSSMERLNIAFGIAKGIHHMHQQEVKEKGKRKVLVHCDIKPDNILLDDNQEPKIADFGLLNFAATGETISVTDTMDGGTFAYMPPEALRKKDVSAKFDVWSFGVILLELLTGLKVKDGEREESGGYLHLVDHVKDFDTKHPKLPIADILDSCWMNENMVHIGETIYKVAIRGGEQAQGQNSCLAEDKNKRAPIREVVNQIRQLVDAN